MAERTFGWVQEAYTISNLKNVVRVFVLDSTINKLLREDKIPRLISDEYHKDEMIKLLSMDKMEIPYTLLKGKGTPKGFTRTNAPCSGIIQAVLPGQRKEYQSDWPADSFLRWAVSIGFLIIIVRRILVVSASLEINMPFQLMAVRRKRKY